MSKSQPIFIYGIVIKDERGRFKNCQLCGTKFSLTLKEHQCKRCKRAVCEKCAMNKAHVQKGDSLSKKPHRLCNFCKDVNQLKRFLDQYGIQFNKDTIGQQWLAAFGSDTLKAKNDFGNAQDEAASSTSDAYDTLKAKLEVVINDIDGFINYSVRDFMMGALKTIESFRQKDVVKSSILRVAGTLLLLYPQIGYSHELILITYLLLCFTSEASAYVLLSVVYAHIIPSQLYPRNQVKYDMVNELAIVHGVLKDALRVDPNDLNVIKSFIKERLKRFIVSMSVNLFLFETTFFIWNSVFLSGPNAYMDLLAQMAVFCMASNQEMQKNKYAHEETEIYMLRNVRTNQLSTLYKQTQMCDMESYKKVYITTRSESIRVDNLNLSARTSTIKPDMQKVSDINQKLQEQVEKRDNEIKKLNLEIQTIREQVKQLQKENSYLQNKTENSDAELYKIKLHESRIDNSELKQQIEQLKKEIAQKRSISNDSDEENINQLKKYEQQVRNLQRQAAEKKQAPQQNIEELKEMYENRIKQMQKQVPEEIRELKIQNQQLQMKIEKMKEDKNKGDLIQQKNDEIDLLTELNEELTRQNEKLQRELRDLKSVGGASTSQLIKVLQEEKQQLQQQLNDNESVYRELLENLNKVSGEKPQIFEFSDQRMGGKHDMEDAKKVVEIKTVQNQILKGLLKENQNYLMQMSSTITSMRQILSRPKKQF